MDAMCKNNRKGWSEGWWRRWLNVLWLPVPFWFMFQHAKRHAWFIFSNLIWDSPCSSIIILLFEEKPLPISKLWYYFFPLTHCRSINSKFVREISRKNSKVWDELSCRQHPNSIFLVFFLFGVIYPRIFSLLPRQSCVCCKKSPLLTLLLFCDFFVTCNFNSSLLKVLIHDRFVFHILQRRVSLDTTSVFVFLIYRSLAVVTLFRDNYCAVCITSYLDFVWS